MDIIEELSPYISFFVYLFTIVWIFNVVKILISCILKKETIRLAELSFFEEPIRKKPVVSSIVFVGILALFLYSNSTFNELVGVQKPLSKKENGTYCYYVDAVEVDSGMNYTVPARIEVDSWLEDDGEGRTSGGRDYFILQLFFDDGTTVVFNEYNEASFDGVTDYYDTSGNEWDCRLTEKHAFSSGFKETSFVTTRSVIELGAVSAVILINWLGGLALAFQANKKEYDEY